MKQDKLRSTSFKAPTHSMPLISSVKEEVVLEDRRTSSRLEDVAAAAPPARISSPDGKSKSNLNTVERDVAQWDNFSGIKDTEEVEDESDAYDYGEDDDFEGFDHDKLLSGY